MNVFRTKPIAPSPHVDAGEPVEGSLDGEATLKRVLTSRQLVLLGIGAIVGAGIFVLTGQAAANHAGPAVTLSFVLAGIACALAGLCYAEFAAMLPVSGSAYSYSYATLGEIVAWFIGWNLILEYLFAVATVAVGWSGYLNGLLGSIGGWIGFSIAIPEALASAPLTYADGRLTSTGAIVNLPAMAIVVAIAALCYRGITQSAIANNIVVTIKLVVIMLFLGFCLQHVDPANWDPFIPAHDEQGRYGWQGVARAASIVFFAYIGFDAISTAAQETKDPQRSMPIGILGSLVVCTLLYIAVCAVLTGMLPYAQLGTAKPVATALEAYPDLLWLKTFVEIGAVAGLSSVILVMTMAQARIFYAMSHDGLIGKMFGRVHPVYRTPHVGTAFVGAVAMVLAGLLPIGVLGDLVSMGTLLAFATVCIGVLVLRYTKPDLPRAFRVPAAKIICPLGALACLGLFFLAFMDNWQWMTAWIIIGITVYFTYSARRSILNRAS
ncbi:MAG TPA: amino acid permease [Steroidobacteraceae bacterium]|nr:amino acid permease [Steroidobacteraceae bacterium]